MRPTPALLAPYSMPVVFAASAAAGAIHPRLIPAALLGVVLGELFYAFAGRAARTAT